MKVVSMYGDFIYLIIFDELTYKINILLILIILAQKKNRAYKNDA